METELQIKTERKNIFDILKALGIISIVIGHCHPSQQILDFVYSYHLALFLFASGLQFNIKKYSLRPFFFVQSRIKSMWPSFFGYLTLFTITHDSAVRLHLLPDSELYGITMSFTRVVNNFIFWGGESLGGALWFVSVMLTVLAMFSAVIYLAYTYFSKIKLVFIVLISGLIGALGVACNLEPILLALNNHTGLLLFPVLTAGFLINYFQIDFNRLFRWFVAIPCFLFVCWTVVIRGHRIELAQELIGGSGGYFYIITFCGLYFVCYLSRVLERIPFLSHSFAFVGRYTFDIMALHFLIFKVMDVCYGRLAGHIPEYYSTFPCAYRQVWPLYVTASVVIAPWVRIGINKLFSMIGYSVKNLFAE